jgi:hypothetical protein
MIQWSPIAVQEVFKLPDAGPILATHGQSGLPPPGRMACDVAAAQATATAVADLMVGLLITGLLTNSPQAAFLL